MKHFVKDIVKELYATRKQIEEDEAKCDTLGKLLFDDEYAGSALENGVLVVYSECGHEFECDEWLFDANGDETEAVEVVILSNAEEANNDQ